jgi:PST family polysaccharide transporter
LRSKALTGASITLVGQTCAFAIGTVGTIVLARLLTPHDFGLVTMVLAFSLLLQNFGMNGFIEATIQKERIDHAQVSTLYWINVAINFVLMLIFMASAPIIAWFYNEPLLKPIVVVMAISILFGGAATQHQGLLRRNMEFAKVAGVDIAAVLASLGIAIVLAYSGWGYWALVARWVTAPVVMTAGGWLMCAWRPGRPTRGTGVRPMLRYAFSTYGNFVLFYFSKTADKVLVGRFLGSQALGAYDRAFQLSAMLPSQLGVPLNSVAMPAFSRLASDPARFRHSYLTVLSILAFICMPVSAIVTLTGRDVTLLLLGPQWESASQLLPIFGLSTGLMLMYFTHAWLHLSLGTPDRWLRWAVIAFIVTMVLLVAGLPFGPLGVAAAYSLSVYILTVPAIWYGGRPVQLKPSAIVRASWTFFAAALGAGLLSWFVANGWDSTALLFNRLNPIERIGALVLLCTSTYLLFVVILHRGVAPISQFIRLVREMLPRSVFEPPIPAPIGKPVAS